MGRKTELELNQSEKKLLKDLKEKYDKDFYIFKPTTEDELKEERIERFYHEEKMLKAGLLET